eukprot:7903125-Pyramimonas_sp.AAC.1
MFCLAGHGPRGGVLAMISGRFSSSENFALRRPRGSLGSQSQAESSHARPGFGPSRARATTIVERPKVASEHAAPNRADLAGRAAARIA